jgi:hypothetical protein
MKSAKASQPSAAVQQLLTCLVVAVGKAFLMALAAFITDLHNY